MSVFLPQAYQTKKGRTVWIRSAVPKDASNVLTFMRQAARESGHFFLSTLQEFEQMTVTDEEKWLESHMTNPCALALIAEDEKGEIIALTNCMNGHRQRSSHIATLGISILQSHHREGLGEAMMGILSQWARQTGKIEKLDLSVDPLNTGAVALYEKLGYKKEAFIPKQMKFGPNDYRDTILMGLWL